MVTSREIRGQISLIFLATNIKGWVPEQFLERSRTLFWHVNTSISRNFRNSKSSRLKIRQISSETYFQSNIYLLFRKIWTVKANLISGGSDPNDSRFNFCLLSRTSAISRHATFPIGIGKRLKSAFNFSECGHLWLLWLCFFEIAFLKIGLIWISSQHWAQLGHNGHLKSVTLDMYCSKIKYLFDLSYTWMES